MTLRALTWLLSLVLHASLAGAFMLAPPGGLSLDEGDGEDSFVVEQGISIEGISTFGEAEVDIAAVEAPPPVLESTPPPVEEVKPLEDVQHVVASEGGPEQENIDKEPEIEEVREIEEPKEMVAVQQTEVPIEEQTAKGAKQTGGSTTALSAYRGKLFQLIARKKVNPRTMQVGTVVVRFTVGSQGELLSREIAKSSGLKSLDDAAIASIEKAAPFPPMPSDASADGPMVVSVPFKFTVR